MDFETRFVLKASSRVHDVVAPSPSLFVPPGPDTMPPMKENGSQALLLYATLLIVLGLWVRTLITGEDIPQNWALLIGSAWGAYLGIRRLKGEEKND